MISRSTTNIIEILDLIQHMCGLCRDKYNNDNLIHKIRYIFLRYFYISFILFGAYIVLFVLPLSVLTFWQISIYTSWLFLLIYVGPSKRCLQALMKLDRHCVDDEDFYMEIKRKVRNGTIALTVFVIVDAVVLYFMRLSVISSVILSMSMLAHEVELMFYALLTNCIRIRLSRLKTQSAIAASKIIRYILLVTVQLVADFKMEIFILIGFIMITSYISMIMTFLADPSDFRILVVNLVWSGVKYVYLTWTVCEATSGYAAGYEDLARSVARRVELHETREITNLEECSEHEFVKRWYSLLMQFKPRFSAGDCFELDLGVPLRLVEVIVSYVLLFVQFYSAYFMYDL